MPWWPWTPRSTAGRLAVEPRRGRGSLVVDTHLHVWNADTEAHPWRPGWARFAHGPSFDIAAALEAMNGAGVDRAVLLPTAWDRSGNELVQQAAAAHPDRFTPFLAHNIRKPLSVEEVRERRGLRFMFLPDVETSWLEDGTADWLWPSAEEAGTPLMLWMPGLLSHLPPILEAHPRLRVALDHLNLPMTADASQLAAAVDEVCGLARFPNVRVKVSGLPCIAGDAFPFRSTFAFVRRTIDSFGAERVFWGSDLNRLPCTYRQAVTMFTEEMPMLTDREIRLVMGEAACAWLGWANEGVRS
jgi:L-fuconolactonase